MRRYRLQRMHSLMWIILFTFGVLLRGQSNLYSPIRIDTVVIMGNEKTRNEVILREIPFAFPDTLNYQDLQLIQNRLQNLFLFNRVALDVLDTGQRRILLIQVTETWYIYPVPIIFISERDWSKISYGFQITHINFRGMNEKAMIGGWLGYNPSFFLSYFNPWIGRHTRLILGIKLFNSFIQSKEFDTTERHIGTQITLGKRLNLNVSLEAAFTFRWVHLPEPFTRYLVSGKRWDTVPQFSLRFTSDYRDLYEYPQSGYFLRWELLRSGIFSHQPRFWRWKLDNRLYLKLHDRLSMAMRNYTVLNRQSLPVYDRIYIGYNERIRGYFYQVYTGQNLTLQSLELRIPLIKIRYFSLGNNSRFSAFTQNLKFGVSMGLFLDTGQTWNRNRELGISHLKTGFGVGLHFHLPFVYLLRLEQAWNDRGDSQFLIDAGVAF